MAVCEAQDTWTEFLEYAQKRCSKTAYGNWLLPIRFVEAKDDQVVLEVPNIFVKEYLLSNFKEDLTSFVPVDRNGEPSIEFRIAAPGKKPA
jgi:chromosomal replication initiator protein